MGKISIITLTGESGNKYNFNVYPIDTDFKPIPVVYYISKRTEDSDGSGRHSQIYIGQTSDASERFDNHHKAQCFINDNANCVSIHGDSSEKSRLAKEADLINAYNPPCNDI